MLSDGKGKLIDQIPGWLRCISVVDWNEKHLNIVYLTPVTGFIVAGSRCLTFVLRGQNYINIYVVPFFF